MRCKLVCVLLLTSLSSLNGTGENEQKKATSGTVNLVKRVGAAVVEANKGKLCFAGGVAGTIVYQNRKEISKKCSIQ